MIYVRKLEENVEVLSKYGEVIGIMEGKIKQPRQTLH